MILCDPHRAVVVGPSYLHGERLESPDIRAGMALLLAALCARGQSTIGNIGQIDRGYERIEEKLQRLGARIERVNANEPSMQWQNQKADTSSRFLPSGILLSAYLGFGYFGHRRFRRTKNRAHHAVEKFADVFLLESCEHREDVQEDRTDFHIADDEVARENARLRNEKQNRAEERTDERTHEIIQRVRGIVPRGTG